MTEQKTTLDDITEKLDEKIRPQMIVSEIEKYFGSGICGVLALSSLPKTYKDELQGRLDQIIFDYFSNVLSSDILNNIENEVKEKIKMMDTFSDIKSRANKYIINSPLPGVYNSRRMESKLTELYSGEWKFKKGDMIFVKDSRLKRTNMGANTGWYSRPYVYGFGNDKKEEDKYTFFYDNNDVIPPFRGGHIPKKFTIHEFHPRYFSDAIDSKVIWLNPDDVTFIESSIGNISCVCNNTVTRTFFKINFLFKFSN